MAEIEISDVVRRRVREAGRARGWSLDALAARCHISASTLSRIETGRTRMDLDQLARLARALDVPATRLVQFDAAPLRPMPRQEAGLTTWLLSNDGGRRVSKMRITGERLGSPAVHRGQERLTVVSGVAVLRLGEQRIELGPGEVARFATSTPHFVSALGDAVDLISVHDGEPCSSGKA
ncbi:XRE family transcriptional regulator [Actinoplanes sp. Pm04-4]|uniref:XRE family transcriptional regulator n=1 Tax=Paractinoplanes pyxinae TaxID=2997416 RepID=A0ABT4B181_9ACTN|nr:XRE family transcriptional regulator [Actinoplanes pyxinae]MCY1139378.1 XRE family transcriptional regulator [Actinoplanes pyxinae]